MNDNPGIDRAFKKFVEIALRATEGMPSRPAPPRHTCEGNTVFIEYVDGGWELDTGMGESPVDIAFYPFCGSKLEAS